MKGMAEGLLVLAAAAVLPGCAPAHGSAPRDRAHAGPTRPAGEVAAASTTPTATPAASADPALVPAGLDLHAPAVAVPLRFVAPSVGIDAPVVATGLTPDGAMDAPQGPAGAAVWQEAFWYRGGAVPGTPGTATLAGHVDDVLGRPAAFWRVRDLRPGAVVEVVDERAGDVSRFAVVETDVYSLAQADTPAVLTRIYGPAAESGDPAQRTAEAAAGVSRLTLVTCTGTWLRGQATYDHRFVAYAVRLPERPQAGATAPR